ncbi:MAG: hypothetical protein ACRD3E_14965 [Terriglobales bacterium]
MKVKIAVLTLVAVFAILLATGCSTMPANAAGPSAEEGTTAAPPFATEKKSAAYHAREVAAGTLINVRLQQSVSSASSRSGDEFAAVLAEPLVANGQTLAPEGAAVTGRVVAARKSGHLHDSGYLRLALASVEINGKAVPVHSSTIFVMGGAHKKRNLTLIGGGAGVGALIGAIAGGGKGALIGSAVGAGAGTAGAYATGKKDVGFGAERRLTFRLTQPLTL